MTKAELIKSIQANLEKIKSGTTKADAERSFDAVIDTLISTLITGDTVSIPKFGTFAVKDRPAHKGHNPHTGEEMDIPACKVVSFRPVPSLKDRVNGKS